MGPGGYSISSDYPTWSMKETNQSSMHVHHPGIIGEEDHQADAQQSEEELAEVKPGNDILHTQQAKAFKGTFAQHI